MKVINKTVWRTDHLKAILQEAARREFDDGARRKRLRVTVEYTRNGGSSGCAFIGGNSCVVRIANPNGRVADYIDVPLTDPRKAVCIESRDGVPVSKQVRVRRAPINVDNRKAMETLRLHFASVASHEFAHCRGMDHARMPNNYKWSGRWREYVAWAEQMPLEVKPVKTVSLDEKRDQRYANICARLALATTRRKRAETIEKKWVRRKRAAEKRMAAARTESPQSGPATLAAGPAVDD